MSLKSKLGFQLGRQRKLNQKYFFPNVIERGGGTRLKSVLRISLRQKDSSMESNNICYDRQPPPSSLGKYSY
jgi:hypothetical protein